MVFVNLHNRYMLMRHAHSVANEKHVIISHPSSGVSNFGLTPFGEKQVMEAIAHTNELYDVKQIYTSDFLRAYQTALLVAHITKADVITDIRLRERFFGQFEGTDSENYHKVWNMDCKQENSQICYDVEPLHSVAKRMLSFVLDCESYYVNTLLLIVSHGDPLQILFAKANGLQPHQFRTLPHFANAEIRHLPSHFAIEKEYLS